MRPAELTNFKEGLVIGPSQERDVREFLRWRYEPPYDVYNIHPGEAVDPEKFEADVQYFLDPDCACHSIFNPDGILVGYCTFGKDAQVPGGDYRDDALDIGLGVHPDWTGQGYGIAFVQRVLAYARDRFEPVALRVTIAEFNTRAQRVWQKAGFRRVARFNCTANGRPFVILTRIADGL